LFDAVGINFEFYFCILFLRSFRKSRKGEMRYVELRPAPETAAGIFVEPRRIFLAFSRCSSRADKKAFIANRLLIP
jgi:hypothetical protein